MHKTNISKTKDQHNGNDNNDIDISDVAMKSHIELQGWTQPW